MRNYDETDFEASLKFSILCDFLAGSSIEDISHAFAMSDAEIEKHLRTALYAYGFRSIA